jgi:TRAP-type uncharacterized transport system substrate-binding protein
MATGKKGKGFSKLFKDLRKLCGSQVQLCEVETEGGLQNTIALSANQADIGFVQLDTLHTMKESDTNIAELQAIVPAHSNLLHILVRRAGYTQTAERSIATLWRSEEKTVVISKLSELKGLPVAVVGSAQLLGRALDRELSLALKFSDMNNDEEALSALNTGSVAAVLTMNGWPSPTVDALTRDSGIGLAAYDFPAQAPFQLVRKNYAKLGFFSLSFFAAPNLLMTRPFKLDGQRGNYVAKLQRCIVDHLSELQEGAFEPAWKEIKHPEEVYGWSRFGQPPARR